MYTKSYEELLNDALTGNIPVEAAEYGDLSLNGMLDYATNTMLKELSEQERLNLVKLAVIAGADKHINNSSILLSAIIGKWTSVVKFLLDQPKINTDNIQDQHHIANSNEDIKTLWSEWETKERPAFSNINAQNLDNGFTWAHHYALNNNLEWLNLSVLQNPTADLTIRDFNGYTPIAIALYTCVANDYYNKDIITALIERAGMASTPYPVLRAILQHALNNTNPNKQNSIKVIELILENSHLLVTDADLEAAKGISKELHIKLSNRKASQLEWNLKAIIGIEEVKQELKSEEEQNSKYAEMLNKYAQLLAPLAINLVFHAIHNVIPVYYTSVAAFGIAYLCKTQQVEMQHAKFYENTMLASAANCCVFAYLNSESSLVQAGSLIGIVAAAYQYYQNNKDINTQANQIG